MIKDLFQRGKCLVGMHQGPWMFSPDTICTKVQICTVCRTRSEKPEHNWTNWTQTREDACDFARRCSRCEIAENRTEHVWRDPEYAAAGACGLHRVCSRCRASEPAGTRHVMDGWVYPAEGSCKQTSVCSRCGANGGQARRLHDWNPPAQSTFYAATVSVCRRCAEMRVPADGDVSLQQSAKAVAAMAAASDSAGFDATVRLHGAVLTAPATQHYLKLASERFTLDAAHREKLAAAGKFAAACSALGVEAAIAYANADERPTARTSAPQPAAASDRRLTGHWRHTEHMSSGGVSMATDTHLVLSDDGTAVCWTHSAGSFGERRSDKEQGNWHAQGDSLTARAGLSYSGSYQTDGSNLLLPGSGRYRLWTKVR